MNKNFLIGVVIVLIILGGYFVMSGGPTTGGVIGVSEASETADSILIPLSDISKEAKWYDYDGIKYFVVEAGDGSVKTAFDACDVCYGSKKGYRQQGIDMVCNNCGNHYAIDGLGTKNLKGGGCWPGYLPSVVEGDNLIIKKSDLEAGSYRF